jgi:hypothetical protein
MLVESLQKIDLAVVTLHGRWSIGQGERDGGAFQALGNGDACNRCRTILGLIEILTCVVDGKYLLASVVRLSQFSEPQVLRHPAHS